MECPTGTTCSEKLVNVTDDHGGGTLVSFRSPFWFDNAKTNNLVSRTRSGALADPT